MVEFLLVNYNMEKRAHCLLVLSSVPVLVLLGDIGDSQLCLSLSLSAKEDGLGHVDLSQV